MGLFSIERSRFAAGMHNTTASPVNAWARRHC